MQTRLAFILTALLLACSASAGVRGITLQWGRSSGQVDTYHLERSTHTRNQLFRNRDNRRERVDL